MEKATILIVDDEQSYLDTISNALKHKNYNILQAINGKMGCVVAEKFLPDVIIMDWKMPVMDGMEAIKYLKSQKNTENIPIIVSTGVMMGVEHLETALEAGAVDFLRKPIDPLELIARLNSVVKLSRAYQQNLSQNKKLEELNATKNKFFTIIAHDLRGPISGITSVLEILLAKNEVNDEFKTYLTKLKETANTTLKLLENLLTWARIQKGDIKFDPKRNSLYEIIIANVMLVSNMANNKQVALNYEVDSHLSFVFDYNMINSTVRNLLTNAVKYSKPGDKIFIVASDLGDLVEIKVKDTGIGIDKRIVENMFRIDVKQFSSEGTHGERGTGLGLVLCKEFVDRHKGMISVESELGIGSSFIVTLPK